MKKNNFKVLELKSPINKNTIKRSVLIKDFIINEVIGIHKHEKINKQKIIFNIVIDVNQNTLPKDSDLTSIVDYEKITNKLENLVKNKRQTIKHFNKQAKSTLLKKAVGTEDICDTVDFFINNNSITGQVVAVDSGQNLNWNIKNEKE